MKLEGWPVEEVSEYAKDLVWEGNKRKLQDQFLVSAEQNWRQRRLLGQVKFCVTDSPLLLGTIYRKAQDLPSLDGVLKEANDSYVNRNFLLQRVKPYDPVGRGQTEYEACNIDGAIRQMLYDYALPYTEIAGNEQAALTIFNILKSENHATA